LTDVVDLTKHQVFFHAGQGNGINIAGWRPLDAPPPSRGEAVVT
jgi:hypothetical protein